MKILKILLVVAALAGAIWFFFTRPDRAILEGGLAVNSNSNSKSNYKTFAGAVPFMNLTFRYPDDWRYLEDKGKVEPYHQAMIIGARNAVDTYSVRIVVRGTPLKLNKGRFEDVNQLKRHYASHLFKDPRVLNDTTHEIGGLTAEDLTVSYTVPPLLGTGIKHSIEFPVKERALFTQNSDCLYEFIYSADAREYDKYHGEFEKLLKSVRFKNTP